MGPAITESSNCCGFRISCCAMLSTRISRSSIPGYSAATSRAALTNMPSVSLITVALWTMNARRQESPEASSRARRTSLEDAKYVAFLIDIEASGVIPYSMPA